MTSFLLGFAGFFVAVVLTVCALLLFSFFVFLADGRKERRERKADGENSTGRYRLTCLVCRREWLSEKSPHLVKCSCGASKKSQHVVDRDSAARAA